MKNNGLHGWKILLASASPRRTEILRAIQLPHSIEPPEVEEVLPDQVKDISELVSTNAQLKAKALGKKTEKTLVVGADTAVGIENVILGKPCDRDEAISMLSRLSGNWHEVHSAICIANADKLYCFADMARVKFNKLSNNEIQKYTLLQEPMDKAGAYAVQGVSCRFIEKIEGSFFTVMGFPAERFMAALEEITGVSYFDLIRQ